MGLALLAVILLGTATAAYFFARDWRRRKFADALRLARWVLALWGLYLVVLVVVSLAAPRKDPGGGEVRFCGLDPQCGLTASVLQVSYTKTLGDPPRELIAHGTYYLITVRVLGESPDGLVRADLDGFVVDAKGSRYGRSADAERMLRLLGRQPSLEHAVQGSRRTMLVFDLPNNVERPSLVLREGSLFERLAELFVIGDEASLLHPETRLALLKPEEKRRF